MTLICCMCLKQDSAVFVSEVPSVDLFSLSLMNVFEDLFSVNEVIGVPSWKLKEDCIAKTDMVKKEKETVSPYLGWLQIGTFRFPPHCWDVRWLCCQVGKWCPRGSKKPKKKKKVKHKMLRKARHTRKINCSKEKAQMHWRIECKLLDWKKCENVKNSLLETYFFQLYKLT